MLYLVPWQFRYILILVLPCWVSTSTHLRCQLCSSHTPGLTHLVSCDLISRYICICISTDLYASRLTIGSVKESELQLHRSKRRDMSSLPGGIHSMTTLSPLRASRSLSNILPVGVAATAQQRRIFTTPSLTSFCTLGFRSSRQQESSFLD